MGHPGIFRELSLDLQYPLEIIVAMVAPETLILELILQRWNVVKGVGVPVNMHVVIYYIHFVRYPYSFSQSYTSAVKVFIPSFKGAPLRNLVNKQQKS